MIDSKFWIFEKQDDNGTTIIIHKGTFSTNWYENWDKVYGPFETYVELLQSLNPLMDDSFANWF